MVCKGLGCMKMVVYLILTMFVYLKAIPKSNGLMKFDLNRKRLRGPYKKLYGITCIILVLVIYKGLGCIEAGRVPHMDSDCCEALS